MLVWVDDFGVEFGDFVDYGGDGVFCCVLGGGVFGD